MAMFEVYPLSGRCCLAKNWILEIIFRFCSYLFYHSSWYLVEVCEDIDIDTDDSSKANNCSYLRLLIDY